MGTISASNSESHSQSQKSKRVTLDSKLFELGVAKESVMAHVSVPELLIIELIQLRHGIKDRPFQKFTDFAEKSLKIIKKDIARIGAELQRCINARAITEDRWVALVARVKFLNVKLKQLHKESISSYQKIPASLKKKHLDPVYEGLMERLDGLEGIFVELLHEIGTGERYFPVQSFSYKLPSYFKR